MYAPVIYEVVEKVEETCNLECKHKVTILREYTLEITETRKVDDLFTKHWGGRGWQGAAAGYKAIDQFGDEWSIYWDGSNTDGMFDSRRWRRARDLQAAEERPYVSDAKRIIHTAPEPPYTIRDDPNDSRRAIVTVKETGAQFIMIKEPS